VFLGAAISSDDVSLDLRFSSAEPMIGFSARIPDPAARFPSIARRQAILASSLE